MKNPHFHPFWCHANFFQLMTHRRWYGWQTQEVICNGFSQNWSKVVSTCILQYKPICVINFDKLCLKMLKSRSLWSFFYSYSSAHCHVWRHIRMCLFLCALLLRFDQPNFARSFAVSWAVTLYVHFWELLPPNGILPGASISFILLYWQRYCTALEQWASAILCGVQQRASPIFGRVAITLGISPHSSWDYLVL